MRYLGGPGEDEGCADDGQAECERRDGGRQLRLGEPDDDSGDGGDHRQDEGEYLSPGMDVKQIVGGVGHDGGEATRGSGLRHPARSAVSLADVLVPEVGVLGDEARHQPEAIGVVEDDHLDPARPKVGLGALEGAVLPHHDPRDAI